MLEILTGGSMANQPDPGEIIKSKGYISILVFSGLLGIPISIFAYFFLYLTQKLQEIFFVNIPSNFTDENLIKWWPLVPLLITGLIVGLTIKYLPGKGGETPIEGFKTGGGPLSKDKILPVALAALASIGLGAVVGPEAPLIALGGGLAYFAIKLLKQDIPNQAGAIVAAAGSFAAVSTLFGNPLTGAFLMMEVAGIGGAMMQAVLLPGLLAAGIGYLTFLGLDSITGLGTFSLAVGGLPSFDHITGVQILWAIVFGLAAPFLVEAIRYFGLSVQPIVEKYRLSSTLVIALLIGLLAILFTEITGKSNSFILFSGQSSLGPLLQQGMDFSLGALLLIVLFKGVAYGASLVAFRGGPTFPAMFIGAALGLIVSHITGIPMIPMVAVGIASMTVSMLGLPFVSVLLACLFLGTDGIQTMPLAIITVVVAFVVRAQIRPMVESS